MLNVLIIDEIVSSCEKAMTVLKESFNCLSLVNPELALATANSFQPDIILLDINGSGIHDFEDCKKLTTLDNGKKPVVMFVSENDDIETKIKAYEAGGHDYIIAPFAPNELSKKLLNVATLIEERNALQSTVEDTQSLAMTSMKQASHYGYIMNFFKNLFHSSDLDEVAALFFDAMSYWDLHASLAIRLDKVYYFESATIHSVSPIERKIFVALLDAGRLYEFGQRLIVNDKHASFLVKNMPSDPAFAGEVRDIVAAIIEGLEAKVIDLKRQSGLELVTTELTHSINNVKHGVASHNQLISSIVTDMMGAVSGSFHSLELTERQEDFFHDLFEKSGQKMMSVEQVLLDIQEQLSLLSNQVEQIIADTREAPKAPTTTSDVELF